MKQLVEESQLKEQKISEGQVKVGRYKVDLNIEDVDYIAQIADCQAKIDTLNAKQEVQRVVNLRTFQETQILLESATAEITGSEYNIEDNVYASIEV